MKVLSLFSGVGGLDMGLENAGMETVFQCELDKHATSVLKYRWPNVPKWPDISTLTGKYVLQNAPVVDVVAWGSPCQDLSIAGKRTGLAGAKSSLFYQGMRVIKEIKEQTNGKYPKVSIWENVVGALSSHNGADFGVVLDEMAKAGALAIEWAVLDAQYFGVPQRRRRVFVVAIFDPLLAGRCPSPLLPLAESVRRNSTTSKPKGQSVTSPTSKGLRDNSFRMRGFRDYESDDTASAIKSRDYKDATDLIVENAPILIDRAAFNQGINAAYSTHISDDPVAPSLVARRPHAVFVKRKRAKTKTDYESWASNKVAPTLNPYDQGDKRTTILAVSNSQSYCVRRLTPLECERLMGWPDDHTRYKADGSEQSDTQRFKQCGNGVASPVAEWVGKAIVKTLRRNRRALAK